MLEAPRFESPRGGVARIPVGNLEGGRSSCDRNTVGTAPSVAVSRAVNKPQ